MRAVARTVLDHPLLQVGIDSAAKATWVKLERILLHEHIIWSKSTTADDVFSLANDTPIDGKFESRESKPGWRVLAAFASDLKYLDVGFVWSHDITDGMGGKIILHTILHHLNAGKNVQGLSDDGTLLLPDANLPPAPETVCKYSVTPMFLLGELWKEYCPAFLHPYRHMMATWAPIAHQPGKTISRSISIDGTALQSVLSQSRKNKTTLTGILHAMTLLSLAARIPAEKAPGYIAETALDLRKLFKPASNRDFDASRTICNMVSSIEHLCRPKDVNDLRQVLSTGREIDTLLWPVARQFRSEIAASLGKENTNKVNGLMKYVSDWKEQMGNHAARQRVFSWSVSNLGVLRNEDAANWRVTKAEFRLSMETSGAAIHVDAVSVEDEGLSVMVNWQEGVVGDAVGRGLASDIKKWLCRMKK